MREDPFLDADQEDDGELQPLRRVERHQHDLIVIGDLVGVGDERDLFEELVHVGELACRADQLAEVLDAASGLDGVLGLQFGEVAGAVEGGLQDVAGPRPPSSPASAASAASSSRKATNDSMPRDGRPGDAGVSAPAQRVDEPDLLGCRERVEPGDAGVPDAPLGHVEDPLHADLVGRVDDSPQVRHGVLDLAAVVEAGAADDLVRDPEAHQRLLDDAALGVGAVQHGQLTPVEAVLVVQPPGRRTDERCFVALFLGVVAHDPIAAAGVGPEVLRLARRVVGDHRVGGVEDRLRAAVVLVEHDGRDLGEGLLELQDVAEVGPSKPVHAVVDEQPVGDVRMRRRDLEVVHRLTLGRLHGSLFHRRHLERAVVLDQDLHPRDRCDIGMRSNTTRPTAMRRLRWRPPAAATRLASSSARP